jgi:hypothetical protein
MHDRPPRQAALLGAAVVAAGSLFGFYTQGKLRKLQHETDADHHLLHQHSVILHYLDETNHHVIEAVNRQSEDLASIANVARVDRLDQHEKNWLQERQLHGLEFAAAVNRMARGIHKLQVHQLSPLLVDHHTISKAFDQASELALLKHQGQLAVNTPEEIYQLPTSWTSDSPYVYNIVVHVPVVRRKLRLHRYKAMPVEITASDHTEVIIVRPAKTFLAHDDDVHQELDAADLHDCWRMGNTYICSGIAALHRQLKQSCLGSLFAGDAKAIRKNCPVEQNLVRWSAATVSAHSMALYFADASRVQISCANGTTSSRVLHGRSTINLPANCVINSDDVQITSSGDILGKPVILPQPNWELPDILDGKTPSELDNIRHHLQRMNISPPTDIRMLLQEEQRALETDQLRRQGQLHNDVGLGLIIALAVIASVATTIGLFLVCRCCMGTGPIKAAMG